MYLTSKQIWVKIVSDPAVWVQGPTIDRSNGKKLCSRVSLGTLSTPNQGRRNWGGGQGDAPPPKMLADSVTLSQPGGSDYAHQITTRLPRFSNLPTSLHRTPIVMRRSRTSRSNIHRGIEGVSKENWQCGSCLCSPLCSKIKVIHPK